MSDRKLMLIFAAIGACVLGAAVALVCFGLAGRGTLGFEIVKLLVQFLLVGILGVLISLLVQNYNRHRDREVTINDLRKAVLARLIRAYSDTKQARRIIMAHRLNDGTRLTYEVYDEQMKSISQTQLALEILNHEIQTLRVYFGDRSGRIIENIGKMEKFLGDIIDEYKDSLQSVDSDPEHIPLASLPTLGSSMGKTNENNFRTRFVEPYREAVATIRNQILESTSKRGAGAFTPAAPAPAAAPPSHPAPSSPARGEESQTGRGSP